MAARRPGDVATVYGDASLALREMGARRVPSLARISACISACISVRAPQGGRRSSGSRTCAPTRGGGSRTTRTVTVREPMARIVHAAARWTTRMGNAFGNGSVESASWLTSWRE